MIERKKLTLTCNVVACEPLQYNWFSPYNIKKKKDILEINNITRNQEPTVPFLTAVNSDTMATSITGTVFYVL